MLLQRFGSDPGVEQTITVPPGVNAILNFASGIYRDDQALSTKIYGWAYLGNDLTATSGEFQNGIPRGLLAISNTQFPPIPVSAGEKLRLAFFEIGSVVIYYQEIENG